MIAARPKLQKWISDAEADDPESLGARFFDSSFSATQFFLEDTFLQINDQINTVVTRYEAFKQGDYSTARNPIPKEFASSGSGGGGLSLIDLDEQDPAPSGQGISIGTLENDLSSLFSAPTPQQQSQQPAFGLPMGVQPPAFHMGLQQTTFPQTQTQTFSPTPVPANGGFPGSSISGLQQRSTHAGTPPASIMLPATPGSQRGTPIPATQGQGYFGKAPVGGMGAATGPGGILSHSQPGLSGYVQAQPTTTMGLSGTGNPLGGGGYAAAQKQPSFLATPLQPQSQVQAQTAASGSTSTTQQGKDPFADLAGLF